MTHSQGSIQRSTGSEFFKMKKASNGLAANQTVPDYFGQKTTINDKFGKTNPYRAQKPQTGPGQNRS